MAFEQEYTYHQLYGKFEHAQKNQQILQDMEDTNDKYVWDKTIEKNIGIGQPRAM